MSQAFLEQDRARRFSDGEIESDSDRDSGNFRAPVDFDDDGGSSFRGQRRLPQPSVYLNPNISDFEPSLDGFRQGDPPQHQASLVGPDEDNAVEAERGHVGNRDSVAQPLGEIEPMPPMDGLGERLELPPIPRPRQNSAGAPVLPKLIAQDDAVPPIADGPHASVASDSVNAPFPDDEIHAPHEPFGELGRPEQRRLKSQEFRPRRLLDDEAPVVEGEDAASSSRGSFVDIGDEADRLDAPEALDIDPRVAALAGKIRAARALKRQAVHDKKNWFSRKREAMGSGWAEHQGDLATAQGARAQAPAVDDADGFAVAGADAPHVRRERRLAEIERSRRPEGAPEPEPVPEPGALALTGRGLLTGMGKLGKIGTKANAARQVISAGEGVTDAVNAGGRLAGHAGDVIPGFKHLAIPGLPSINELHLDTGLTGVGGAPVTAGLSSALVIAEHGGRALQALAGAGMEKLKKPEEVGEKEREEVERIQQALDEIHAREAAGIPMTPAMTRIKLRHMVNLEKYSRKLGKKMQDENLHSHLERTMDETSAVFGGTTSRVWKEARTVQGRDGAERQVPAGWHLESSGDNDFGRRAEVEGGRAAQNSKWRKFGQGMRGVGRVLNHTDKGEEELVEGQYGTAAAKAIGGGVVRVAEDIGGTALAPIGGKHLAKGAMMTAGLLTEGAGTLIANAAGQKTARQQDLVDLANKYNHGVKITRDADGNDVEEQVSTRRQDILQRGYVPRKQEGPDISSDKAGLPRKDYTTKWNDWRGRIANGFMRNGGARLLSVLNKFLPFGKLGKFARAGKSKFEKLGRGIRRWWRGSEPDRPTPEAAAESFVSNRDRLAPGGDRAAVEANFEARYGNYFQARREQAAARRAAAAGAGGVIAGGVGADVVNAGGPVNYNPAPGPDGGQVPVEEFVENAPDLLRESEVGSNPRSSQRFDSGGGEEPDFHGMLQGIPGAQGLDNFIGKLLQPEEDGNVPQQQALLPKSAAVIPEEE